MATGKTHDRYVNVIYNSQTIPCRINNMSGVGITYDEADITTFCDALHMFVLGQGNVEITLSGPFDNTATSGAHAVFSAAVGNQTGYTLTIQIGIRAAATTGDPEFEATLMLTTSYVVNMGSGVPTWTATLKPGTGAAAAWGTV